MMKFIYKISRKFYSISICMLFSALIVGIIFLVREGILYSKYGSMEILKCFDYGNGDINLDGVINYDDYYLLQAVLGPNLEHDGSSYDQDGISYLLEQSLKENSGVKKFDEYVLQRVKNRADCKKEKPQVIDLKDLSSLEDLIK